MPSFTSHVRNAKSTALPIAIALALPTILIAVEATPIGLDFIYSIIIQPALLIAWGLAGIVALIVAINHMRNKRWRTATAWMIPPLTALAVGLQFWSFIRFCNYAGDLLFFLAKRPSYVRAIAKHEGSQPQLLVFNRGGMIWASRGFVYDESDEILLNPSMQSAAWKEHATESELSCGYQADAFPGYLAITKHWYIASFPC